MRDSKRTIIITTIVCLIPVIMGIILYDKLPAQIATHWDSQGNVNGVSSKFVGAIGFPAILAALNLLVPFFMRTDPKYENMNPVLRGLSLWIIPVVSIFASSTTLAAALGYNVRVEVFAPMLCGLLFVVVGNYLPKTRQSYTMGIKLPWTLNSEDNWNKTHRLAGFVWVIGGVITIVSAFLPVGRWLFMAVLAGIILIPVAYSYLYFRKEISAGR